MKFIGDLETKINILLHTCFDRILRSIHKPKSKLYIAFNTNLLSTLILTQPFNTNLYEYPFLRHFYVNYTKYVKVISCLVK